MQEEGGMPAGEKNRTKPEQNKFKRVVDPLHAMIIWFRSGFLIQKIDDSLSHRRKSLSSVRIAPPARAFSFLLPTHHIPLGVTGIYRLSVLLEYSLILSLPSWKVK